MTKRLFIGNLAFAVSEDDLQAAFAPYGSTQATIPTNESGRSRGFGFVDVADDQVDAAIAAWDGKELRGRPIVVNVARPRPERSGYGGGGGGRDRGSRGGGYGSRW